MSTYLFTIATVTNHYQMKDSPSIKFNTENSIALSLIVLISWPKIKILVMASHFVTMVIVNIARCEMQAYYILVPATISRCEVQDASKVILSPPQRCEVRGARCEVLLSPPPSR